MTRRNSLMLGVLTALLSFGACTEKTPLTPYQQLLKEESRNKNRVDSLFFDISLGMEGPDFYNYCAQKNKEEIFKEGPSNMSVNYVWDFDGESVDMNFYPDFEDAKISLMTVEFVYKKWAPWAKEFSSEVLIEKVMDKFRNDYGDDFIVEKDLRGKNVYIDIDGNRKILVEEALDGARVKAIFTDLSRVKEQ